MNFRLNEGSRFPGVCSLWAGVVVLMPVVGCALIGVEPEEIDWAAGSESDEAGETSQAGETEGGIDTNADDGGDGDGDGDSAGGDGDGDSADETDCAELGAVPLTLGSNDLTIDPGESVLEGSCGHPGPERIYSYVGDEAVNLELTLNGFEAALYAVDGIMCLPLVELSCVNTPEVLTVAVEAGQLVHVVVDAALPDGGSGTLDVAIVP
jgi:hypothetical protein